MTPKDKADLDAPSVDLHRFASLLPFSDLSDVQLKRLLDRATVRRISSNDNYFEEGDAADNFYVLLDGVLRVVRSTSDGDQVVALHVFPGQMFGIAKAFDNSTYTATARAASEGLALSWPSDLWDEFVREYPGFRKATRRAVGARVKELQDKIVEMATLQVEKRIAHAILRLMKQAGEQTENGVEIGFPITRQDLSEMTGTTLHSVSRYMSKWQKSGIVTNARRRVIVRRPEDLPT